jgi:hypothetical protein
MYLYRKDFFNSSTINSKSIEKRALHLSKQDPNAGAWMTCSLVDRSNRMSDDEFVTALRLRFLLPIHPIFHNKNDIKLFCSCRRFTNSTSSTEHGNSSSVIANNRRPGPPSVLDPFGHHAMNCPKGGDQTRRHDDVDKVAQQMSTSAGIPVQSVPRCNTMISSTTGDRRISDHKTVTGDTIFDTVISNPICSSVITKSSTTPGHAAENAVIRKRENYKDHTNLGSTSLQVISFETTGRMAQETLLYIKRLASKISFRVDIDYAIVKQRWIEKFSVMLQRGNARIIATKMNKAIHQKYGYKSPEEYLDLYKYKNE